MNPHLSWAVLVCWYFPFLIPHTTTHTPLLGHRRGVVPARRSSAGSDPSCWLESCGIHRRDPTHLPPAAGEAPRKHQAGPDPATARARQHAIHQPTVCSATKVSKAVLVSDASASVVLPLKPLLRFHHISEGTPSVVVQQRCKTDKQFDSSPASPPPSFLAGCSCLSCIGGAWSSWLESCPLYVLSLSPCSP